MKTGVSARVCARIIPCVAGTTDLVAPSEKPIAAVMLEFLVRPKPFNYDDPEMLRLEVEYLAKSQALTTARRTLKELPGPCSYHVELTLVEYEVVESQEE